MKLIKVLSILLLFFSCQTTSEERKAETTPIEVTEIKTQKEIPKFQLDSSVVHTDNKYYNLAFQEINQMLLDKMKSQFSHFQ
ncbi:hypothetical protein Fleli_2234 [Bernardetia litoralis DSM 6794]|uniref:Uncharacterized protein n=1 Tax=Bernardetia litoralis (strain ATCC 23117 / DSM 6794 / NBRC 15988 / NCIMB 1366 / Fx l1 / Sio-4) TaxID=880071 RepID=I4AKX6_BERLS|nr:hypothetical protein [Bernardetia litoralis]AFM04611.1 hypothetical protein Fleli_2234 [Bernardetia litoralis DSM 6794]